MLLLIKESEVLIRITHGEVHTSKLWSL